MKNINRVCNIVRLNKLLIICLIVFGISNSFLFSNISYGIVKNGEELIQGIDVSGWQGYIDYEAVEESGIKIVYIKSSEGESVDPYFELNYKNAKDNGLKIGVYHYVIARSIEEAKVEAKFFVDTIKDKSIDCLIAMDYENFDELSNEEVNEIAYTFLTTVKEYYGKDIIVYSDLNDVQNVWDERIANEFKLWIAYYNDYNLIDNLSLKWDNWTGIQYTDEGTIPGVRDLVDRDYFTENIFYEEESVNKYVSEKIDNLKSITRYVVRRGDSLWKISREFDTTINNLVRENGIENKNLIYVGEILNVIPNYNNLNEENSTSKVYYKVRRGDTLFRIAKMYNIDITKIVRLNNIRNPNLIYPNQILKIPN